MMRYTFRKGKVSNPNTSTISPRLGTGVLPDLSRQDPLPLHDDMQDIRYCEILLGNNHS
jgi:hypothetical protein